MTKFLVAAFLMFSGVILAVGGIEIALADLQDCSGVVAICLSIIGVFLMMLSLAFPFLIKEI